LKSVIRQILTKYWGYNDFRPLQEEIILSVLDGKDTLALMPTGGGKSICFQVPALAKEGICVVVSPLIALMKDQVEHLKAKGIPAVAVISGMSRNEIDIALDNCIYGKEKFLYISPERLTSDILQERLQKMNINLLAIDEAHCISQWGYDFRPSYLKIAEARRLTGNVPVLALTASATGEVIKDIQEKLHFRKENVFKKSFERKNLSYVVIHEEDKLQRLINIINKVEGTGIVYVRNRKKTKEVAELLKRKKISAGYYHAGLESSVRNKVQDDWMKGTTRVIAATNAFGMGIDKSNVRFVIHLDLPESLEAYYQEAGRGGRDEAKAYAVLLYNNSDRKEIEHRTELNFPEVAEIRKTYQALTNYYQLPVGSGKGISFDFDIVKFSSSYNLQIPVVFNCLKVLELQGLIATTESVDLHARIHFKVDNTHLYEFQVKNETFDHLIKVILRSHEGVFDDYVNINETEIATRAGFTKDELVRYLVQLDKLNVLSYLPAKDFPQIIFTEERLDIRDVHIDRQHLAARKQRYTARIKAMLAYATGKTKCRSQILLNYFGEDVSHRCGSCDYCLGRNKLGISELEFSNLQSQLQIILSSKSLSLNEILPHIKDAREERTLKVVEWLIDNEKIRYVEGNLLEWND
jgi:ATP-dependent DNA helicase RecQ